MAFSPWRCTDSPASAVSSSVSWGVYFASALALVAACSPFLVGVKNYSCEDSAAMTAKGALGVIDALGPGMVVSFSFRSPSPQDVISLNGRSIMATCCGASSTLQSSPQLPTMVLLPGQNYSMELVGGQVEVLGFV